MAAGAVVLGAVVGIGVAYVRRPKGPSGGVDAGADASAPSMSVAVDVADAGPGDAPKGPSWVDLMDAADPPPESQLDPDYLITLVDMVNPTPGTITFARTIIAGRRHHANQGNYKIAHHNISRKQCLDGLRDLVLQTPEQREICGGPYEVPVHRGDPASATSCIDIFEYPNRPCELPFVHTYGMQGEELCAMGGKRLCSDEEWNTACEADPNGGESWQYAYGNELDLSICNTGKPWPPKEGPICRINDDLWNTCATNTEPNGSFPKCRSRLGVFDLHGNIAEAMYRFEDGVNYVQLKGSAWFYDGKMYKDHCRFDPRWHVDKFKESWHDNYHLGFRCCRSVKSLKQRMMEGDAGAGHVTDAGSTDTSMTTMDPTLTDSASSETSSNATEASSTTTSPTTGPSTESSDDPYQQGPAP
jgi:hypothetical protein